MEILIIGFIIRIMEWDTILILHSSLSNQFSINNNLYHHRFSLRYNHNSEFLGYTIYKNGPTFIRDSIVKDLIKEIVFYKYHGYSYEELFRNRLLYVLNALYFIKDFNAYNYIISLLYHYNIQSPILDRPTKEEENFNKDMGVYMKSFFKKYL